MHRHLHLDRGHHPADHHLFAGFDPSAGLQSAVADPCDPNPTTNCVPGPAITTGCPLSQAFTNTATDACNNTSLPCTVTFTWTEDTTPPTITCSPASIPLLVCNPPWPTLAIPIPPPTVSPGRRLPPAAPSARPSPTPPPTRAITLRSRVPSPSP